MTSFTIERYNDIPLQFDGVQLASVSSVDDGNPRWQELTLYRTDSGKFVLQSIGKSTLRGEHDLVHVYVCVTPREVRDRLRRTGAHQRTYIPDLAADLLDAAGDVDAEFKAGLIEEI